MKSNILLMLLFVVCDGKGSQIEMSSPLQLCCDPHHYFSTDNETCVHSGQILHPTFYDARGISLDSHPGILNVTYRSECPSYFVSSDKFQLRLNGSVKVISSTSASYEVDASNYCLIWLKDGENYGLGSLICFPEDTSSAEPGSLYYITNTTILPITMSISAIFLLATFLIYCLVPELQDLLGKSFMCSIFCLALSKIFAVIVKTATETLPRSGCIFVGLGMHSFFLQAFFWLNVISIIVFSSLWFHDKYNIGSKKLFSLGCLYAFGIPILVLILILLHDHTEMFGSSVVPRPGFGNGRCWFSNRGAMLVYFYAPIAVLVCVNIVLFCLSACKICSIATRSSSSTTFQFKNYLKLFLLMGVSWIFEVLSFLFMDPNGVYIVWFIFDMFNGLLGVIIFFVFACRKKLLKRAAGTICGSSYARETFPESTRVVDTQDPSTHDINLIHRGKIEDE